MPVVVLSLACAGATHPVPLGRVSPGERLLTIEVRNGHRALYAHDGDSIQEEPWDLALDREGRISHGGSLTVLDDGDRAYCGYAFNPDWVSHCWRVHDGQAQALGPPLMDDSTPRTQFLTDHKAIARNGAWWKFDEGALLFSPSLSTPPTAVPLPFKGSASPRVAYSAASNRLALTPRNLRQEKLWVLTPTGEVVDAMPVDSTWIEPMWNPAGDTLAMVTDKGLLTWTLGNAPSLAIPKVDHVDGHHEVMELLAWSPDGTHVLLNSSRYTEPTYNPCAGIYNTVFETFIVELSTGDRLRVERLHGPTMWVRD